MFNKNSSFQMTEFSCRCERRNSSIWIDNMCEVPENLRVVLQTGVKYGVLTVYVTCPCCDEESARDYLFHNHTESTVIHNMEVLLSTSSNRIQLYLPHGDVGCFDLTITSPDYNDGYILKLASYANIDAEGGVKGCVDSFFEDLYDELKLQSGFRRFSNVVQRKKRSKTRGTRLYCLWFLYSFIPEPLICKEIIVLAKLW